MAKITEYPVVSEIANDDVLLVDGELGTRGLSVSGFSEAVAENIVGSTAITGLVADIKSDIQDAGDDVIASIPQDYSALSADVNDLKSNLGDLADLETADTSSIVAAINEAKNSGASVPTAVRQAILALFENAAYATTGLTDEIAVVESWAEVVTSLTLSADTLSLSGATPQALIATTVPSGKNVTWESSNTSIATVNNGVVTGVDNGVCNIIARSGDLTARCVVTVSGFANLTSISAVYTQSGTVYETSSLEDLRSDLVVTANYSDSTTSIISDYTLSGTLVGGASLITVLYGGKTTTFSVIVPMYGGAYTWAYDASNGTLLSARTDITTATNTNATETLKDNNLNISIAPANTSRSMRYDLIDTTSNNAELRAKFRINNMAVHSSKTVAYGFRLQLSNGSNGIMFYQSYTGTTLKLVTYSGNTLTQVCDLDFDTWYIAEVEQNNGTYSIKLNGETVYTSENPATYYATANRIQVQNTGSDMSAYSVDVDIAWIAYKDND